MNQDNFLIDDCKASWRAEARATAIKEADEQRLQGPERDSFVKEREARRYEELEKLGLENL